MHISHKFLHICSDMCHPIFPVTWESSVFLERNMRSKLRHELKMQFSVSARRVAFYIYHGYLTQYTIEICNIRQNGHA